MQSLEGLVSAHARNESEFDLRNGRATQQVGFSDAEAFSFPTLLLLYNLEKIHEYQFFSYLYFFFVIYFMIVFQLMILENSSWVVLFLIIDVILFNAILSNIFH